MSAVAELLVSFCSGDFYQHLIKVSVVILGGFDDNALKSAV